MHGKTFTQRNLNIQKLLHRKVFTKTFAQGNPYTEELLHWCVYTQKLLHTGCAQKLLHRKIPTWTSSCRSVPTELEVNFPTIWFLCATRIFWYLWITCTPLKTEHWSDWYYMSGSFSWVVLYPLTIMFDMVFNHSCAFFFFLCCTLWSNRSQFWLGVQVSSGFEHFFWPVWSPSGLCVLVRFFIFFIPCTSCTCRMHANQEKWILRCARWWKLDWKLLFYFGNKIQCIEFSMYLNGMFSVWNQATPLNIQIAMKSQCGQNCAIFSR